jgi:hypothetical protein
LLHSFQFTCLAPCWASKLVLSFWGFPLRQLCLTKLGKLALWPFGSCRRHAISRFFEFSNY